MAKVGSQASQIPAVVRAIRSASPDDKKPWKERVKDWQRAENARRGKSAPQLKVDGIVGKFTTEAIQNKAQRSNQWDESNYKYDVNVRNQGRNTSNVDTTPPKVTGYGFRGPGAAVGQRSNADRASAAQGQKSSRNLRRELGNISADRRRSANYDVAEASPGQKTETLYERMKGDKDWIRRYREELKRKKGEKPVPRKDWLIQDTKSSPTGRPNSRNYKSQAATLQNLRPWEREELQRKFQNENISSTARTYRGGIR